MKIEISACGNREAAIVTDDISVATKMIHSVIADGESDQEFADIADIVKISALKRERSYFRWGGQNGDLYLVTFL